MNAAFPRQFAAALLTAALAVPLNAQKAHQTEDPAAFQNHAVRGSQNEKELLEKIAKPQAEKDGKAVLPAGAEVKTKLGAKERPALRFLKEGKTTPKKTGGFGVMGAFAPAAAPEKKLKKEFPQHQNKLENKDIRHPKDFTVQYALKADADVVFTLHALDGMPLAELKIPAGKHGAKQGNNELSIWDGRDFAGRELPPGDYYAEQIVTYAEDDKPRTVFPLPKK